MAMSDSSLKLLDIIVKGVLGTAVTILVTLYGIQMQRQNDAQNRAQQLMQERVTFDQQKTQEIINLESQQKDLDVNIAQQMFQSLTTSIFNLPNPRSTAAT
jgi:hypothetical protein